MQTVTWVIRSVPTELRREIRTQAVSRGLTLAGWLREAAKRMENELERAKEE